MNIPEITETHYKYLMSLLIGLLKGQGAYINLPNSTDGQDTYQQLDKQHKEYKYLVSIGLIEDWTDRASELVKRKREDEKREVRVYGITEFGAKLIQVSGSRTVN